MTDCNPVRYEVMVEVRLRPGIADPEGATIARALPTLGFPDVADVSVGKAFRLSVEADTPAAAAGRAAELARRLLANPVIEDAAVSVLGPPDRERTGPAVAVPAGGG